MFVMYVNDISTGVSSTVKLYADITKLYRKIENIPDDTRHVSTHRMVKNLAVEV